MILIDKKRLLLIALLSLSFASFKVQMSGAANAPWNTQEKSSPDMQAIKNNIEQLKNRRDAEIANLLKERNAKIQAVQDGFKQLSQKEIAKIKQDRQLIQEKKIKSQDMKKAQALLMQQEQALRQQSAAVQKQIANIQALYQQQIQNLTQAYAQQFATIQQKMPAGK